MSATQNLPAGRQVVYRKVCRFDSGLRYRMDIKKFFVMSIFFVDYNPEKKQV
jgi:hypothetical protein